MSDLQFSGRLFGPGLPGAGATATGRWDERGRLYVETAGAAFRQIHVDQLEITAAGFNFESLRISWQGDGGAYAFAIDSETDKNICTTSAPTIAARHFNTATGASTRLERRFRFGSALLGFILALPLLGIGIFLYNSNLIADWAVRHIPVKNEAQLGELVLAQTRLQTKLIDRGPAIDAISAIGIKLTAGSVHNYRWFIADRPDINAFAAPGGIVVVYSGLIRTAGSAEELAGVLAHEIAHAELRHTLRVIIKSLGIRALVSLVIGDISGTGFADTAARLTELSFSREAEREADVEGLRRMIAARIDPNGMLLFYEKLAAEKRLSPPVILSTHPATGERLENLRREVLRMKQNWGKLPVDILAVKDNLP